MINAHKPEHRCVTAFFALISVRFDFDFALLVNVSRVRASNDQYKLILSESDTLGSLAQEVIDYFYLCKVS